MPAMAPGDIFERAIAAALDEVPAALGARVDNLEVLVGEENDEEPDLYGLYEGTPLTERGSDHFGPPDIIHVYRRPLLEDFGDDPEELAAEIRVTVLHELGHYFGIDEDRLEDLGWA